MGDSVKWYENVLTRVFGGKGDNYGPYQLDPFVKGYGFIYLEPFSGIMSGILGSNESLKLSALARSVSIGNITLEAETIEGLGGVRFTHPTKLNMPDRVTVEFMETMNSDVLNILKRWVSAIRDIRFGTANMGGLPYSKNKFSTNMHVIITQPNGSTPLQIFVLTGVYPLTIPIEGYNFNVTDNSKADLSVEFAFDNFFFEDLGDPTKPLRTSRILFNNEVYDLISRRVNEVKRRFMNP